MRSIVRTPGILLTVAALLVGLQTVSATEPFQFEAPVLVDRDVDLGRTTLAGADLATDGGDTWVAAFRQMTGTLGLKLARSADGGRTWAPTALFATETLYGPEEAKIHGSPDGRFVTAWIDEIDRQSNSFEVIKWSRSDGGQIWSTPETLIAVASGELYENLDVVSNGNGVWAITWFRSWPYPYSVMVAVSEDNGATWSPPAVVDSGSKPVNPGGAVAIDAAGNCVYVYDRGPIRSVTGTANCSTWSGTVEVADSAYYPYPRQNENVPLVVETDGQGRWLTIWNNGNPGGQSSMLQRAAVSTDVGATWTVFDLDVTDHDGTQLETLSIESLSTDGRGNWVSAWTGSVSPISHVYLHVKMRPVLARSTDGGVSWGPFTDIVQGPSPSANGSAVAEVSLSGAQNRWLALWWTSYHPWWMVYYDGQLVDGPNDLFVSAYSLPYPYFDTCAGDTDGDGFGSPGDPACPAGPTPDCDDTRLAVRPGGDEICDGFNNDCDDPGWPALPASELDGDGDGVPACADCDDTSDQVWTDPTAAVALQVEENGSPGDIRLTWSATGNAVSPRYDVLRNASPQYVDMASGECLASDLTVREAFDATTPGPGAALYYLIRELNDCPAGGEALGYDIRGWPRSAISCP